MKSSRTCEPGSEIFLGELLRLRRLRRAGTDERGQTRVGEDADYGDDAVVDLVDLTIADENDNGVIDLRDESPAGGDRAPRRPE